MKISILAPDLSTNCLGRAYMLAKVLQRQYEVEIIGPLFGEKIWDPVAHDKNIVYKSVEVQGILRPYIKLKRLTKNIDGDIIYACKPLFASFGIGLLKKKLGEKPLILDIDDWEMGFAKYYYSTLSLHECLKYSGSSALFLYHASSYWNSFLGEKLVCYADEVTVSNRFLRKKFGGTIVWHGRDTENFDPEEFDRDLLREEYNIEKSKKVVMFFGTLRPYKGIEDLIRALKSIKNENILLVIAGIDKDPYCKKIVAEAERILRERVVEFGLQPFEKVPEFLTMADVVVIPQKKSLATIGQLPAKVFDAMAMAKPIVAADVSDLLEILDGCGYIVEPENVTQLAETIQYVLEHPEEAEKMGWKARQKCEQEYSWDAIEKILVDKFRKYE